MKMRILPVVLASALLSMAGSLMAADSSGWLTDYKAALQEAKASNKPILADFTGSDWCGWCMKLSKETFTQPAFLDFAKKNLVLLEVDFPQSKPQSDAVKQQNDMLSKKFQVDGFPTIVLLDKDGKEIARNVGYMEGGPSAMIGWIKDKAGIK